MEMNESTSLLVVIILRLESESNWAVILGFRCSGKILKAARLFVRESSSIKSYGVVPILRGFPSKELMAEGENLLVASIFPVPEISTASSITLRGNTIFFRACI